MLTWSMVAFGVMQLIVSKYITKFDEFLIRCGENESDVIVLSKFRSGLREDLKRELFAQDNFILEQAFQLV